MNQSRQHGSSLILQTERTEEAEFLLHRLLIDSDVEDPCRVKCWCLFRPSVSLRGRGGRRSESQSEPSWIDSNFPSQRCPQSSRRQNIFAPCCPNPAAPPSHQTDPLSPRSSRILHRWTNTLHCSSKAETLLSHKLGLCASGSSKT